MKKLALLDVDIAQLDSEGRTPLHVCQNRGTYDTLVSLGADRTSVEPPYAFKYNVIGDSGAGKSCLFLQFTKKRFRDRHSSTIVCEVEFKEVQMGERSIRLVIMDIAGDERYRGWDKAALYKDKGVALLVYDITRRESFNNLTKWLEEVHQNDGQNMTIVLIGNKCDLEGQRQVSTEEGEAFALEHGLMFLETSAKTTKMLKKLFLR